MSPNVSHGRDTAQGPEPGTASARRGLDPARALPYIRASRTPRSPMPRSKSKRKILRHRWKVQKKHRLERKKAEKKEERGR
jgi:hypothetical protein